MNNVLIGFLLVIGAGLSTLIGAGLVFFKSLVKLENEYILSNALGISTGVMLYVSFIEIFSKSTTVFEEEEISKGYIYSTLLFFSGFIICFVIDKVVHQLDHLSLYNNNNDNNNNNKNNNINLKKRNTSNNMVIVEETEENLNNVNEPEINDKNEEEEKEDKKDKEPDNNNNNINQKDEKRISIEIEEDDKIKKSKKLKQSGILTALAIGIHNFPEGLITFVASLNDPKVGAILAVAIGIHNIPEGICVSIPMYYARNSRGKAFGWAFISAISEPIGALIGWAIIRQFEENKYIKKHKIQDSNRKRRLDRDNRNNKRNKLDKHLRDLC